MNNQLPDGGPAFPLGLRDYLAAHAPPMPDEWPAIERITVSSTPPAAVLAAWAYAYADAMLAERDKEPPGA